jgi:hypothetical protein
VNEKKIFFWPNLKFLNCLKKITVHMLCLVNLRYIHILTIIYWNNRYSGLYRCWILSWAVTLKIFARRRGDKPMKNL